MNECKTFQRVTLEKLISQKLENSKLLNAFLSELPDDIDSNRISISLKYSPEKRVLEEWNRNPEGSNTRQVTPLTDENEIRKKVDSRLSGKRLSRTVDKQGRRILYVER